MSPTNLMSLALRPFLSSEVHEELVSLYQTPAERAIYVHLANRHRPRPSSGDSDSRPEETWRKNQRRRRECS